MKILAKDLQQELKRKFSSFYFIFGEEPLQRQECLDLLRTEAKEQGAIEREIVNIGTTTTWPELLQYFNTPSLFSTKRLIELHLLNEKINQNTIALLQQLTNFLIPLDVLIILIASKIDFKTQQSPWFTLLTAKGVTLFARTLTQPETFTWLQERLATHNLSYSPAILPLLWAQTEGNLLAAAQLIEKLSLLKANETSKTLTLQDIDTLATLDARFSVFDLIDAAISGSLVRTFKILYSLKNEGVDPNLIIWAIAKEVRTNIILIQKLSAGTPITAGCQQLGIWKKRESIIKNFIQKTSKAKLYPVLRKLKTIDDMIKGRTPGNVWDHLLKVCLTLTINIPQEQSW